MRSAVASGVRAWCLRGASGKDKGGIEEEGGGREGEGRDGPISGSNHILGSVAIFNLRPFFKNRNCGKTDFCLYRC